MQAFVNTLDIENGVDELSDPGALAGVLALDVPLRDADLRRALEVREALRALALANNGLPVGGDALATLERAAVQARFTIRFDVDGRARLVPAAGGLDGALGGLLSVVHEAMADGSWRRLKACRRDVCHWIYYDRSRNGSSTWCAMTVCGNRTNTRAYRRRAAMTRAVRHE